MKEKYLYMLHAASILHQVVADHPEILTAWCFRPMPITPSSMPSHGVCVCVCVCNSLSHVPDFEALRTSLPGSSVHGSFQTRILLWVAIPFSVESSRPRDWTRVSPLQADSLTSEAPGNPLVMIWLLICTFLHRVLIRAPLPCHESSFRPCGTHDPS